MEDNGMLKIHLSSLLKTSGMSKNKFCQKAEMQHLQLKGYIDNTITWLDTDALPEYAIQQTVLLLIY